jgi:hypothetical protein
MLTLSGFHYKRFIVSTTYLFLNFFDISKSFQTSIKLLILDVTVAEIFEKDFCLENFYDPKVSDDLYTSVLMCKNAESSFNATSQENTAQLGCRYSMEMIYFYRTLRFTYTICGLFSLIFLALTLFLYQTIPGDFSTCLNAMCCLAIPTSFLWQLRFFETWCKRRIFHTYLWFI